jgi:hypothetical protein
MEMGSNVEKNRKSCQMNHTENYLIKKISRGVGLQEAFYNFSYLRFV